MNRKPFNRSGFNRPSTAITSVTGFAQLKLGASPVFANRAISALALPSRLVLWDSADGTIIKTGSGNSALVLYASGNAAKVLYGILAPSVMALKTLSEQSVQGESVIDLQWLVLAPGGELIINTEDMTVTVNGQNGMEYFSLDSEFFNLLNGANTIVFSDGSTGRNINFDIIWKDRWL